MCAYKIKNSGFELNGAKAMTTDEVRQLLDENLTLPVPKAGEVLGLKRNQAYACAKTGDIEVLKFGRLKKVSTAWLKAKLGL